MQGSTDNRLSPIKANQIDWWIMSVKELQQLPNPLYIDIESGDIPVKPELLELFKLAGIGEFANVEDLRAYLIRQRLTEHLTIIPDDTSCPLGFDSSKPCYSRAFQFWNIPILYSVGSVFTQYRNNKEAATKLVNDTERLRRLWLRAIENHSTFRNYFVLDSGGYQATMGYIPPATIPKFVNTYYDFVVELVEKLKRTYAEKAEQIVVGKADSSASTLSTTKHFLFGFHLDLLSDWDTTVFKKLNSYTIQQIFEQNRYERGLKDRMVMVFQLLGHPRIHKFWTRLFDYYDIWNRFNRFSIGGLVAFAQPLVTSYTPAVHLLHFGWVIGNFVSKRKHSMNNDTVVHYHILGIANPYVIPLWFLIRLIARKWFGINLHVTYDSSMVKRFMSYRRLFVFDEDTSRILDINLTSRAFNSSDPKRNNLIRKIYESAIRAIRYMFGLDARVEQYEVVDQQIDKLIEICPLDNSFCYMILHHFLIYYAYERLYEIFEPLVTRLVDGYLARTGETTYRDLLNFSRYFVDTVYRRYLIDSDKLHKNRYYQRMPVYMADFMYWIANLDLRTIGVWFERHVPKVLRLDDKLE